MIHGLVTDDHAVVRKGLVQILGELKLKCPLVLDEADSGLAALQATATIAYDFVLLDIALPDMNGLEVLKQLRSAHPHLPVLVLSIYPERQYALRALQAGAAGYLTKDSAAEELLAAVRQILRGESYISRAVGETLNLEMIGRVGRSPHELLSDREFEVLVLIGQGKTPTQIARFLSLSVKTVSTYRSRILSKLELNTTAELIRYAVDHELV